VLGHFRTAFTDAATWVALVHRPADVLGVRGLRRPTVPEHVAFLRQMRQPGYLVAAGPLGDEAGAGIAILKLLGADRLADATALATADPSVVHGLVTVDVRPWNVMFTR
jgi:uncharacterized protein YciI